MTPMNQADIDKVVEAQEAVIRYRDEGVSPSFEVAMRLITPAALRALLTDRPRVWTAETIKDAPDGRYRSKYSNGWAENHGQPLWSILQTVEAAERRIVDGKRPVIEPATAYFGPIPQPPEAT